MRRLTEAVIAVTYRCNARCVMCDIWKKEIVSEELEPKRYRKLPRRLKHINITGGEPFLRGDLCEIIKNVRYACPKAIILISTNGLLPEVIEEQISKVRDVGLRISIDGMEKMHNKMRGTDEAFQKAIDTINRVKKIGVKDIGIGCTATKFNQDSISEVKELADSLGVEFSCTIAHSSDYYFGDQRSNLPDAEKVSPEFEKIKKSHLKSLSPKEWFRAYFIDGLIDYVNGKKRKIKCGGATISFYMDPYGAIFPCNILNIEMGNIKQNNVESIFNDDIDKIKKYVNSCSYNCWMSCTVSPTLRKSPFPAIAWIFKNKLKLMLNLK